MALFKPAESSSAFLKMGILGKQGAGKSYTAGLIAIGLVKYLQERGVDYASKPVAFFDTETGSDWLIDLFKNAGVPLVVAKKKSFADLLEAVKWSEKNASALIIDSITHPWRELQESYLKKKQRSFMQIDDWGYIKGIHGWAQFTDLYINTNLHIIMCGRAGDETEQYTDENGKRQFEKVGVKMKTEGETGFEPSLLVLMEREMDLRTKQTTHHATVLKDRADKLDGAEFDDPGFAAFLPHIARLNLGATHVGVQSGGDSQHILTTEKRDWQPVQRRICIDEIQNLLVLHIPGQTAAEKQRKVSLIKQHFQAGWVEIEEVMALPDLRQRYDSLHRELEGKPSKYTAIIAETAKGSGVELNDSLPDHSAPPATVAQNTVSIDPAAIEQQLIADIQANASPKDCMNWVVGLSARLGKGEITLTPDAYARVGKALFDHQQALAKQPKEGEPGKDAPTQPAQQSGGEKLDTTEDPATGAPAYLTRKPSNDAGKPKAAALQAAE